MARRRSRHAHRRSLLRRIRHRLRKRKWIVPSLIVLVLAVSACGFWLYRQRKAQEALRVTAGNAAYQGSGYRDIIWQGKQYTYNNRVTAILYAGVDSEGELKPSAVYTSAPRADSIQLIVMDEQRHRLSVLALSRDTMTDIRKYTLDGMDRGLFQDHLGYAYTYGEGGTVSCRSLCEAVSLLLYGIPIKDYMVVNRSSLETLARIIGPVEVVVPNDDLASLDEAFHAGNTVTITEENLEFYVRSRDTAEDLSNVGRMERQRSYISAAMEQIQGRMSADPSGLWSSLQEIESCMQTDISRSRYLSLAESMKNVAYSPEGYLIPEGEQVVGDRYDEFYPDEESLLETVVKLFYLEK